MKKSVSILVITMLILLLGISTVNAVTDFKVTLTAANGTKISQGEEVVLTINVKDFKAGETGINSLLGVLDYDQTVFETVKSTDFAAQSGWGSPTYNDVEGGFVSLHSNFMSENHDFLKLTLKVKKTATLGNTVVTLKDLEGSDSTNDIHPADAKITLTVKAASDTNTNNTNNSNTNNIPVNTNTNTTMPKTGVEDYILPTMLVVAVIGIFAYVKYNRIDK